MEPNKRLALYALIAASAFLLLKDGGGVPGIVDGPRTVVVLRESAKQTPALKTTILDLRDGEHAEYLKSKGHTFLLRDPDDIDASGQPDPFVQRLNAEGQPPPALFVLWGNTIVSKQAMPASADAVIAAVKGAGG